MFCRNSIGKPVARTRTICAQPNESKYSIKSVKISSTSLSFNGTQNKNPTAFSLSGVANSFKPHATDFKTLCWLQKDSEKSCSSQLITGPRSLSFTGNLQQQCCKTKLTSSLHDSRSHHNQLILSTPFISHSVKPESSQL